MWSSRALMNLTEGFLWELHFPESKTNTDTSKLHTGLPRMGTRTLDIYAVRQKCDSLATVLTI